jgi:hypothetical protein
MQALAGSNGVCTFCVMHLRAESMSAAWHIALFAEESRDRRGRFIMCPA